MSANQNVRQSETARLAEEMTRSELRCLTLVAEGQSAAAMSEEMALSSREVELLLFCAQRKLGADNLLQAVSIALSKGLITV